MSREEVALMLEDQDNRVRSLVRYTVDVAKSKLTPPHFPKTVDELMEWLATWQLVIFMQYAPM
jgi:hypothetical protein